MPEDIRKDAGDPAGQDRPGHSQDRPGHSQDRPGHRQDRPGHSQDRPGHSQDRPKKRRRLSIPFKIFLILVLLLGLTVGGAYLVYRHWLADPENIRALAMEKLDEILPGKRVRVGSAGFGILAGLDLYNIEVYEPGFPASMAKLEHLHIDFDFTDMWRLKFKPKQAFAWGLYLDLVRDAEGRWNLTPPTRAGGKEPPLSLPFAATLKGAFVSIDDRRDGYAVSFGVDTVFARSDGEGLSAWRVTGEFGNALMGRWSVGAYGDAKARNLNAEFTIRDLDLGNGMENRIPPFMRRVYVQFLPTGLADVKGMVDYDPSGGWDMDVTAFLKNAGGMYDEFPLRMKNIAGRVNFNTRRAAFSDITGEASGGKVRLSGVIDGYRAGNGVHIMWKSLGTRITPELLDALPKGARAAADMFNPEGAADSSGRLDRGTGLPKKPVTVALDIYPRGISAAYDGFPLPVTDVTGHISYDGKRIVAEKIRGRRGQARFTCEAIVDVENTVAADVKVHASDFVLDDQVRDLLPEKVAGVWKDFQFSGRADADAVIRAARGEPLSLDIGIALADASIYYRHFPYALNLGTGRLTYKGDLLTIEGLRFRHGEAVLGGSGTVDARTGHTNVALSAEGLEIDGGFIGALPASTRADIAALDLFGTARVGMTLVYDPRTGLSFSGIGGRLERGGFVMPQLALSVGGARGDFAYEGDVLRIKSLEGTSFSDNSIVLMSVARLAMLARPATAFTAAGEVSLAEGAPSWRAEFDAGRLFVDESVLGRLPEGVRDVIARRRLRGLADVKGTAASGAAAGKADFRFSLAVSSHDMAVDLAQPLEGVAGALDLSGESTLGTLTLVAKGAVEQMRFAGRQMGRTDFTVEKTAGEARVHKFTTSMLGGTLDLRGRIALFDGGGYMVNADIKDMNLREILRAGMGYDKETLSGNVSGRVTLQSISGHTQDTIGTTNVTVTHGTLWEVPLVLSVLNVLNLKLPEQTLFDSARIRADIYQNRLLVDEFSMASDPATIVGTGVIGLDGTLNMTFFARPGRIPIVSVLAGEVGRNIVKARVSGSFSNPQVALEPSGLFGGLINILGAPFRAARGDR